MNTNNSTQPTSTASTEQAEGLSMGQAVEAATEQAASLAALQAQAGPEVGQDGQPVEQGQGEPIEPERVPLSVEIAEAIGAGVTLLAPIFPTLAKVYTPQTVERLSVATERVCVKRGWLSGGLFGGQSEEIVLAAVLIPVGLSTWAAIRADLTAAHIDSKPWLSWVGRVRGWFAGKRREDDEPKQPGANTVTVGTVGTE